MNHTSHKDSYECTHYDFGVVDSKGRKVGCYVGVEVGTMTREVQGFKVGAEVFAAYFGASRNGEAFGAIQNWRYFDGVDELNEQIASYLKNAKARAIKSHA
jgi:basic membrane lipoprotein Med (substrate-binding protein (PBP1-ABC) superfamily)